MASHWGSDELADGSTQINSWVGLNSVNRLTVGEDGSLYVSQLFAIETHPVFAGAQGRLTRINPDGTRDSADVPFPGGVAVSHQGDIFVSAFSIAPRTGLVEFDSQPVPGTSGQIWRVPEAAFSPSA